jgi:ubiquinone/menaquinone biosynthesis C-methylase UbiE
MKIKIFDEYAEKYDSWFLKNMNVLDSEIALLAHFLKKPGHALSVGCGSGLFEMLLRRDYNIGISEGLEPSEGMANIARKRGLKVQIGKAEAMNYKQNEFDTVIFNGSPSYIKNLKQAFREAYRVLKSAGSIVILDVPKESSYALLYNLAKVLKSWDNALLEGVAPYDPYPIEFVKAANWRTTQEKIDLLQEVGFKNFKFAQTLTRHPLYSNIKGEEPCEGYDRGDYVAICGYKP